MKTWFVIVMVVAVAALVAMVFDGTSERTMGSIQPSPLDERRLSAMESGFATFSARLDTLEKRSWADVVATQRPSEKKEWLPILASGSYTEEKNAFVYDSDAKLSFPKGVTISSPEGVMVSDLEQKMVVGDLTVETPTESFRAIGALVNVAQQKVTAKSFIFTPNAGIEEKQPNQSAQRTGPSARR